MVGAAFYVRCRPRSSRSNSSDEGERHNVDHDDAGRPLSEFWARL
jgi:hypothetical protein